MGMRDRGSEAKGDVDWVVVVSWSGEAADGWGLGLETQLESVVPRLTSHSAMRRRLRGGSPVSKGVCKRDERVSGSRISNTGRKAGLTVIGGAVSCDWHRVHSAKLS